MTNTAKATTTKNKGTLHMVGGLLILLGCIFLLFQVVGLFTGAKFQTISHTDEIGEILGQVANLQSKAEGLKLLEESFDMPVEEIQKLLSPKLALENMDNMPLLEKAYIESREAKFFDFMYYYVTLQAVLLLIGVGVLLRKWNTVLEAWHSEEIHKTIGRYVTMAGIFLLANTLLLMLVGNPMKFFPMWQVPIAIILLGAMIARLDKIREKLAKGGLFYSIGYFMVLVGGFFAVNIIATIITGGKLYSFLPYYVTMQVALALIALGTMLKALEQMVERVRKEGVQLVIGWVLVAATVLLGVNWLAMSLLGKPTGVPTFPVLQILVAVFLLGLALCKWTGIVAAYKKGGARFVLSWLLLIVGLFLFLELLIKGILAIMDVDNAEKLYKELMNDKDIKFKKTTAEFGYILIHGYLKEAVLYGGIGIAAFVLIRKFSAWHERTFTDTGYKLTQIGKAIHSIALVAFPFVLVYALVTFLIHGWQQAAVYAGIGVAGLLIAWIVGVALNSLGLVTIRNEKEAARDVVVNWTCDECGAENPVSIVKCKSCGHINP